jgi:quercetin dioxygenase-like cupin family protein
MGGSRAFQIKGNITNKKGNAMRIHLTALVLSFMILPALGQAPGQTTLRGTPDDTFKYLSHDQITKGLMTPWPGKAYSSVFGSDHEYFFVEFVKRLDHGNYVENHTHWIDQTTILSGEGTLTYGGTITDPEKIGPGEVWGHKQVGGKTIHVRPGDFVLIPINTPHHFDALPGTVLNYVVYKHRV